MLPSDPMHRLDECVCERYTAPEMCVCVWCVSYFSEGANDGALNDASEEDEVDVLGPWS